MIKRISGIAALVFCLTFSLVSCEGQKKEEAALQKQAAELLPTNGVYILVHDGHGQNRPDNYVQVEVLLEGDDKQVANILVSSPPENTQTNCSLQTTAQKVTPTHYQTKLHGVEVNFFFENGMLTIDTVNEGDRGVLQQYCAEGASLYGNYKLIGEN